MKCYIVSVSKKSLLSQHAFDYQNGQRRETEHYPICTAYSTNRYSGPVQVELLEKDHEEMFSRTAAGFIGPYMLLVCCARVL